MVGGDRRLALFVFQPL